MARQGEWEGEPVRAVSASQQSSAQPCEWAVELQSQGRRRLIVLECGRWGSQEVMTSPLLYKLTSLARWCQRWPLVLDQDIVCLCLCGHSPRLGRVLLSELCSRHRKPQCTPAGMFGYYMWGERPAWRDSLALFHQGGVGIFPCPSEDIDLAFLKKPELPAVPLLVLFVLCLQLWPCWWGVSPWKRGRFPLAGNMAPPEADGSFPL